MKRTDRTTRKHLERITVDKAQIVGWKRGRRGGRICPAKSTLWRKAAPP